MENDTQDIIAVFIQKKIKPEATNASLNSYHNTASPREFGLSLSHYQNIVTKTTTKPTDYTHRNQSNTLIDKHEERNGPSTSSNGFTSDHANSSSRDQKFGSRDVDNPSSERKNGSRDGSDNPSRPSDTSSQKLKIDTTDTGAVQKTLVKSRLSPVAEGADSENTLFTSFIRPLKLKDRMNRPTPWVSQQLANDQHRLSTQSLLRESRARLSQSRARPSQPRSSTHPEQSRSTQTPVGQTFYITDNTSTRSPDQPTPRSSRNNRSSSLDQPTPRALQPLPSASLMHHLPPFKVSFASTPHRWSCRQIQHPVQLGFGRPRSVIRSRTPPPPPKPSTAPSPQLRHYWYDDEKHINLGYYAVKTPNTPSDGFGDAQERRIHDENNTLNISPHLPPVRSKTCQMFSKTLTSDGTRRKLLTRGAGSSVRSFSSPANKRTQTNETNTYKQKEMIALCVP